MFYDMMPAVHDSKIRAHQARNRIPLILKNITGNAAMPAGGYTQPNG